MENFSHFFIRLDDKPRNWADRITAYVGYLINCGKQSCTIKSYILALKMVLLDNGISITNNQYFLSSLMRACKLENDRICQRLLIRKDLLLVLLKYVNINFQQQPYLNKLYQALFSTLYFGLFCVGELTWTKRKHAVLARKVQVAQNKKKFQFTLFTSKTHGRNAKPQKVKISSTPIGKENTTDLCGNTFCLYQKLRSYIKVRGKACAINEQFFVFTDGSPVAASHVCKVLRATIKSAGFKHKLYNTSGFRGGRAVDLMKFGVSVETIEQIGRWKSNVVFRWFKFTLKPPYSIARGKLQLAIWDTSLWTFWLKFGHKGP